SVIITFSGASTTVCYLSCSFALFFSLLLLPRPPRSPLFPYTTLFRSDVAFKVSAVFIRSHYAFKRVHYFSLVTIVMRRMIDGIFVVLFERQTISSDTFEYLFVFRYESKRLRRNVDACVILERLSSAFRSVELRVGLVRINAFIVLHFGDYNVFRRSVK